MDIREIEKIIDHVHEKLPIFQRAKNQLLFDIVASFADYCSLIVMSSMLNPFALSKITEQMDALNMALLWVEQCAKGKRENDFDLNVTEESYKQCVSLLNDYAYPYSTICSSYISYSRKRMVVDIEDNTVTFNTADNDNNSSWVDILREANESFTEQFMEWMDPIRVSRAVSSLNNKTRIEDGKLCYEISNDILDPFVEIATLQWNATKTLPDAWMFDNFSLDEYKRFWVQLAALCYVHFFGCLGIKDPKIRLNNGVIVQNRQVVSEAIAQLSGIAKEKADAIIEYLTYDAKKKNTDIMYQPILSLAGEMIVIAPMLFMGSRPERNLLALVGINNNDTAHSKEVNDLENLMIDELETVVQESDYVKIAKHKDLGGALPDVDFAILDKKTNTAIVCELKWFAAADSTKEVYAKEDEITHGCEQVDKLMGYALKDKHTFFKRVFDINDGENYDLYCCVIAKHNIRTQHKHVPVIDLPRMLSLLAEMPLETVFHTVRSHQYEPVLPSNATITYKETTYGGFTFNTPAICFGPDVVL